MNLNYSRVLQIAIGAALISTALAAPPPWWAAQGVTNSQPADDFAHANIGQLKNMVKGIRDSLNSSFTPQGGAGPQLEALVASWTNPVPPTADDYALANIGQAKQATSLVYNRLVALNLLFVPGGISYYYPWSQTTADDNDFAVLNIGQLKQLFNFTISLPSDRDGDGLPDLTELVFTKTNPELADSDSDGLADGLEDLNGNGVSNWSDFLPDGDGDGVSDTEETFLGTDPADPAPTIALTSPAGAVLGL